MGHCQHCRIMDSTFISTESSVTTYCIHLVGHCSHCIGTAYTFRDSSGDTATTAGSLHPAEVALQAHCYQHRVTASSAWAWQPHSGKLQEPLYHCRITASTFMGTASSIRKSCIHLVGNCIQCRGTASTFTEMTRGNANTAGSVYPPSWELHALSKRAAYTLWENASNAEVLHPHSVKRWGSANSAGSVQPLSCPLHPLSQRAAYTLWGNASTACAQHPTSWALHHL